MDEGKKRVAGKGGLGVLSSSKKKNPSTIFDAKKADKTSSDGTWKKARSKREKLRRGRGEPAIGLLIEGEEMERKIEVTHSYSKKNDER